MRGNKIKIPWYRREIITKPDLDDVTSGAINFKKPKSKPNNPNQQPELSPEPVPQPNPNPNPSTNPNPNPSPKTPFSIPIEFPNSFPQLPTNQPFPVPDGNPVGYPFKRPAAKPLSKPNTSPRRNPVRRNPVRQPAAAIDLLNPEIPFPVHQPQPWEIVPVGGLTPIENVEKQPWLLPTVEYARRVGVDAEQFKSYMISYDYANFSVKGMYGDLNNMYGQVAAAILIGYIIASIPLGVPGVPGI